MACRSPETSAGPSERAGFIEAPVTARRTSVQGDRATDRDRSSLTDGPRVGRDGHDHEHQERAQHDLPEERLARPNREGRAEVGDVPSEARSRAPRATAPAS